MKYKYTQRQWDREVGWGLVPPEYALEPKTLHNQLYDSIWNPCNEFYKKICVKVNFNMKIEKNKSDAEKFFDNV